MGSYASARALLQYSHPLATVVGRGPQVMQLEAGRLHSSMGSSWSAALPWSEMSSEEQSSPLGFVVGGCVVGVDVVGGAVVFGFPLVLAMCEAVAMWRTRCWRLRCGRLL
jgi:hypothetical protein